MTPYGYVIRYLDHRGDAQYYIGTDDRGGVLFSPEGRDAKQYDRSSGQRHLHLCLGQDFDGAELVQFRDSMC